MEEAIERFYEFLSNAGMSPDQYDINTLHQRFLLEMEEGLQGKGGLAMLPTYLSDVPTPRDQSVIAIDVGGTNLRVALIGFDSMGFFEIRDLYTGKLPGGEEEITSDDFFLALAEQLEPVIQRAERIGICFSFPCEILPDKDGRILDINKGVKITGAVGKEVGKELQKALIKLGLPSGQHIVLLNDTVATLLGGKASFPDRPYSSHIGFILGTGTNTCYIEHNKNIVKAPFLACQKGSSIVNIEAGGFNSIRGGTFDRMVDAASSNPGDHLLEKMISGGYIGTLVYEMIKGMISEGILSSDFGERFARVHSLSGQDVSEFCVWPYGNNPLAECAAGNRKDVEVLSLLCEALADRSARLICGSLGAILEKSGKGDDPARPVCIVAEGSTFYKFAPLRPKVDLYTKSFLNDRLGRFIDFVNISNVTLIGTALAATD